MRGWRETFLAACGLVIASAQPPAISQNGVMNAAAHTPTVLPGGAIARGARFLIRGVRLGADRSSVNVVLRHGGNLLKIPLETANAMELDGLMPSEAPLGDSTLVVETGEGSSKPFAVPVVASQPGLFAANERGWGLGKIDNLSAGGHSSPNTPASPARPGQMAAVLMTGLGDARQVELKVSGRPAPIASIQRDFEPGVERIQFRVPTDAHLGCFVPIYARTRGSTLSNMVTMAIAAPGSECSQYGTFLSPAAAAREGLVALTRTATLFGQDQRVVTEDQAYAMFVRIGASALDLSPLSMLPPAGQCNGLTGDFHADLESLASFPSMAGVLKGKELDAGAVITLNRAGKSRRVPRSRGSLGSYWSVLGVNNPSLPRAPALFFSDADYSISGLGGQDVEAFSRNWPGPGSIEWINRDRFTIIDRARSATFLWHSPVPDAIVIMAMLAVDDQTAAGAICFCTARGDAGRLIIPPEMLAHFPATRGTPANPGTSMLIAVRRRVETQPAIRGLDGMVLVSAFASVRRSSYR
jgi:uncharacterized protein (TIGR03437 family)